MRLAALIFFLSAMVSQAIMIPARSISVDSNTVAFPSERLQEVLNDLGQKVYAWINPTNGITQAAGDLRWMAHNNYDAITIGTNASGKLYWMNPSNSIDSAQLKTGAVSYSKLSCATDTVVNGAVSNIPTSAAVYTCAENTTKLYVETNYFMAVYSITSGAAIATFVPNTWTQRLFNTVYTNTMTNCVSLSSNTFLVVPGTYYVRVSVPAMGGINRCVLYDRTTTNILLVGSIAAGSSGETRSRINGRFTITGTNVLAIDHICSTNSAMGQYLDMGWGNSTNVIGGYTNVYNNLRSIYSEFELFKIK